MHVGNEAFVTRDKLDQAAELVQGRTPGHLVVHDSESIIIPSGQFAYLIAQEKIRIPNDAIGFISIKTQKKFHGLVNVSGFHVDPGWSGRLIFAVFNAGPLPVVIHPGEKLFLLFFANLDEEAEERFRYRGKSNYHRIPSNLMSAMSAPVPTLYKLNDIVKTLEKTVQLAEQRSNFALGISVAILAIAGSIFVKLAWDFFIK